MNRRDRDDLAVIPWALAGALLLLSHACEVDAQPREPDAVLLARVCVSEASWTCWDSGDGYAIHHVLQRGARRQGISWRAYARAYARRATGAVVTTHPRLSWVAGLREDGLAPLSWPRVITRRVGDEVRVEPHPPWSQFRARWLAVLERAREVATWSEADHETWGMCAEPPDHWGGEVDEARAQRLGLVPIDCGPGPANTFYRRPR
jgi:hypothetical protein